MFQLAMGRHLALHMYKSNDHTLDVAIKRASLNKEESKGKENREGRKNAQERRRKQKQKIGAVS